MGEQVLHDVIIIENARTYQRHVIEHIVLEFPSKQRSRVDFTAC